MKLTKLISLVTFMSLALLYSCSEDEPTINPTEGMIKIVDGVATDAEARVEIWAYEDFFVGYNPVYVALYDVNTGKQITNATVKLTPLMSMTSGMKHACPVENPKENETTNSLFPGSLTFIMGTSEMGSWKLGVEVFNTNVSKSGSVTFDIAVAVPVVPRLKSFTEGGISYFVSYLFPKTPKVGVNDIVVMINKMETMMSFPATDKFTIGMEPEMPSMGHGSPNNVDPVHAGNGHYNGKVNFTMTGEWRLNFALTSSDANKDLYFDLEVN